MFFEGFGVDDDVIDVDGDLSSVDEVSEDVVHYRLERHRRVCQSKEHDCWLEQSSVRSECRFPFVSLFDSYIVVSPSYVELCEDLRPFEVIY